MEEQTSSNRRRFFKRAALATLIGSLAAGIGIKAFAHGHSISSRARRSACSG